MNKNRYLILLLAAALILTACVRPASQPPDEDITATPGSGGGFPLPGTDVMGQLELFATQTAQALQGQTGATPALVTPGGGANVTPGVIPTTALPPAPTSAPVVPQVAPTNPPAQPVVVPKFEVPRRHTLQKGEYIYCIARRFDVNPADLLRANNLGTNQTVYAGTRLEIPQGSSFPGNRSLRKHPTTYTVTAGDTIYSIACLFGDVDPRAIAAVNGLSEPYRLSAGDRLEIP